MGLGKTVQALCAAVARDDDGRGARVLVVCPSSVVRHWSREASGRFAGRATAMEYAAAGKASARHAALGRFLDGDAVSGSGPSDAAGRARVVVVSYAMLRRDADRLAAACRWSVVVFDEVHALRNPDSGVAKAAGRLRAGFRVGLSGTPVHNSPMDLWGVLDAVVPGLLGERGAFSSAFHRPVRAASSASAPRAAHARASAALASLHSLIRPFVLRRTKGSVLLDLPPKIVQDVPCELSAAQRSAYAAFVAGDGAPLVSDVTATGAAAGGRGAVAGGSVVLVTRLRQICNHAALVAAGSAGKAVPISSSGKLLALHALLQQCGLSLEHRVRGPGAAEEDSGHAPGVGSARPAAPPRAAKRAARGGVGAGRAKRMKAADGGAEAAMMAGASLTGERHRVLLFSQSRRMLDMVEASVLGPYFPHARFGRIDGTTPANRRQEVADRFNSASDLDGVLLTTAAGGLGLTLTGADVVIFVDHDWNPVNDLQAMDRAHRIGQRRTVHVFRLVAQDTLEERIMGLQAFKRRVAASLVSADGAAEGATDVAASLATMHGPSDS